jgi:hypothetical protein
VTVIWYQGGLKPEAPKNYVDVTRIGNGAIFEGTKGTILADFTSRAIIPNNDDGDLTYYKRRTHDELLPLVGGTGQPSQPSFRPARPRAARAAAQPARRLPGGMAAMPSAEVGPSGFPAIQFLESGLPPALGLPNTDVDAIVEAEKTGRPDPTRRDPFQADWIEACKGKSDRVVHGTSSKTHCDFDYSGTMIEQMLLGLVAHRIGKKLAYDPVAGRITNAPEANDYLKREYRPNWTLNG